MAELLRMWTTGFLLGVFQTHWHIGLPHSHLLAAAGRKQKSWGLHVFMQRKAPRRYCDAVGRVCPEGVVIKRGKEIKNFPGAASCPKH